MYLLFANKRVGFIIFVIFIIYVRFVCPDDLAVVRMLRLVKAVFLFYDSQYSDPDPQYAASTQRPPESCPHQTRKSIVFIATQ